MRSRRASGRIAPPADRPSRGLEESFRAMEELPVALSSGALLGELLLSPAAALLQQYPPHLVTWVRLLPPDAIERLAGVPAELLVPRARRVRPPGQED